MIIKKELRIDTEMMVWLVENKVAVAKHLFPHISVKLTEGFEPKESRSEFIKKYESQIDDNPTVDLLSPLVGGQNIGVVDATLVQRDLFVDEDGDYWSDDGISDHTAVIMIPDREVKIPRIFEEAELYVRCCSGWASKFVILTKHYRLSNPPSKFQVLHPSSIKG